MSSLWRRANGPQYRMLKIVSGAVLNTAHAHPNQMPDRNFARSVAKRAVGTLSSQWPEVLAASGLQAAVGSSGRATEIEWTRRSRRFITANDDGGASLPYKARPFSRLCDALGVRIGKLRAAGDHEAADAVLTAILCLAPLARRERGKPALSLKCDIDENDISRSF